MLDAAMEAGLELPHSCMSGSCLTCPGKLKSGKVDQSEGVLEEEQTDAVSWCSSHGVRLRSFERDHTNKIQYDSIKEIAVTPISQHVMRDIIKVTLWHFNISTGFISYEIQLCCTRSSTLSFSPTNSAVKSIGGVLGARNLKFMHFNFAVFWHWYALSCAFDVSNWTIYLIGRLHRFKALTLR